MPAPTPDGLIEAREELARLIAAFPGAYIEDKGASIAAHTRPTRDPAAALAQLEPKVQAIGRRHHLSLEPGRFVLELRAPGVNKGHTLEGYVAEVGAKAVIFIGDDLGDLPAFDAVRRLRASGLTAIAVASASAEAPEVAAAADAVVEGPTGVVRLLRWLAGQDDPNNGDDTKRA